MAISWLVWIGTGTFSVLMMTMVQQPKTPSVFSVFATFLVAGYLFWSLYFGLAACWRFALGMLTGTASIWIVIIMSMLPPGWIGLVFAILYSWFGGGIYQFARRWWLLTQGRRSPFLTA